MTSTTTRQPAPAAATRPGRSSSAPARDDGLDRLLADPRLCSTAKAVAVALVRHWAWKGKDHCWPSDRSIAAKVGRSAGHVQRCLRQLEHVGWVERERTDEVPNGRRIWLNWRRESGAGAQPGSPPARTGGAAPARDKGTVVIVNRGSETRDGQDLGRPRRGPSPPPPPSPSDSAPGGASGHRRGGTAGAPTRPPSPPLPSPQWAARTIPQGARRLGLSLAELARAAGATADPILARELARLTAPAPPPEAPPSSLSTPDLLGRLPGRHDLVMAAARRLCVETGDDKAATLRTFEGMCRAVAGRMAPDGVLAACWRQALGPKARHAGKVLVAAWQRESKRF